MNANKGNARPMRMASKVTGSTCTVVAKSPYASLTKIAFAENAIADVMTSAAPTKSDRGDAPA
jgi:hypothetical protein